MNCGADKIIKVITKSKCPLLHDMLAARRRSGLKQWEVTERMGTQASAITRLEATKGRDRHSPTINTLRKYAQAVGCKIKIKWEPIKKEAQ